MSPQPIIKWQSGSQVVTATGAYVAEVTRTTGLKYESLIERQTGVAIHDGDGVDTMYVVSIAHIVTPEEAATMMASLEEAPVCSQSSPTQVLVMSTAQIPQ